MLFFKRNKFTSAEQLKLDFEDYPPNPISTRSALSEINFEIVYQGKFLRLIRSVSTVCGSFKYYKKLKNGEKFGIDAENQLLLIKAVDLQFQKLKDYVFNKFGAINEKKLIVRVFLYFILFFATLAFLPIFVVVVFYYTFRVLKEVYKVLGRGYGYYSKIPGKESKIFFNIEKLNNNQQICHESAISHEHIHLLQHDVESKYIKSVDISRHRNFVESIVQERFLADRAIYYYIEREESEARLHEVVISHYRKHKQIPVNYYQMMRMVFGFDDFLKFFDDFSGFQEFFNEDDFLYSEPTIPRERELILDLSFILRSFSNDDIRIKYITEVWPMLYGNLLLMYSSEESKESFLSTVPSLNMYYQLYPAFM